MGLVFSRNAAYHEAGHAVMGVLTGVRVHKIKLSSMEELFGTGVEATVLCDPMSVSLLPGTYLSLFKLAGYEAECVSGLLVSDTYDRQRTRIFDRAKSGEYNDFKDFVNAGLQSLDVLEERVSQCRKILSYHWQMVRTIADALDGHRQVGGERLQTLLLRALSTDWEQGKSMIEYFPEEAEEPWTVFGKVRSIS